MVSNARWMVAVVALTTIPLAAHATTSTYLPTEELSRAANLVLRGTVVRRTCVWENELIVTHVQVRVEECWAGECTSRRVVVRELGGELDGLGLLPIEPTVLETGREVLLFARVRGALLEAVGGNQGIFTVDPGTETAVRQLHGVDLTTIQTARVERVVSLRSLRRTVNAVVTVTEGGPRGF